MARNTGESHRQGAIKDRIQIKNPVTMRYVKIDTRTGRILEEKKTEGPYKRVKDITRGKK